MNWTKESPTEPGWYWTRRPGCNPGVTCFISSGFMTEDKYVNSIVGWNGGPIHPSEFERFAGPIPEPTDPTPGGEA